MNKLLNESKMMQNAEKEYDIDIDKLVEKNKSKCVVLSINDLVDFSVKGIGQPFRVTDSEVDKIAESMQKYGQITPIAVRKVKDKYQVLSGHVRKTSALKIGKPTLEAVVLENIDDKKAFAIVKQGNAQRNKLLPSELALLVEQSKKYEPKDDDEDNGLTVTEIAKLYDVSRKHIYRCYNMLRLNNSLWSHIDDEYIGTGFIEKIIDNLSDAQQIELAEYVDYQAEGKKKISAKKIKQIFEFALYCNDGNASFSVDGMTEWIANDRHLSDNEDAENEEAEVSAQKGRYSNEFFNRLSEQFPDLNVYDELGVEKLVAHLLEEYMNNSKPF